MWASEQYVSTFQSLALNFQSCVWARVLCQWFPACCTQLPGMHREATTLPGSWPHQIRPVGVPSHGRRYPLPLGKRCLQFRTCSLNTLVLGQHPHRLHSLGVWALHNLPPALIRKNAFCLWKPSSADLDYKWIYQYFLFFLEKKEQGRTKAILAKQYCVALEHCLIQWLSKKICWQGNPSKNNLRKQYSCNLMDIH